MLQPGESKPVASTVMRAAVILSHLRTPPGTVVLSALFLGVSVLAGNGDWLTFPLGPAMQGGDLIWQIADIELQVVLVLNTLFTAAALLVLFDRRSALILMSAGLSLQLVVPLNLAFSDSGLVSDYVMQSYQRQKLGALLSEQDVPNLSPEPAFMPIDQAEGLFDRLRVSLAMLGWGWFFSLGAALGLLSIIFHVARLPYQKSMVALLATLFMMVALQDKALQSWASDSMRRQGDLYLVRGQGSNAVDAYSQALHLNPDLGSEWGFFYKAAAALGVASAGRHPLTTIAPDTSLAVRRQPSKETSIYAMARQRLAYLGEMEAVAQSGVESALLTRVPGLLGLYWLNDGILLGGAGNIVEAMTAYERSSAIAPSSSALMYLADANLKLHAGQNALSALSRLDMDIAQTSFKADIQCGVGDAYTVLGQLHSARSAYVNCGGLDDSDNYRATRALAGS